jgi:DNA-binding transcriptional regulator PaaX
VTVLSVMLCELELKMSNGNTGFGLKFESSAVSPEMLQKVLQERAEAAEKAQAALYADDMMACQAVVNTGLTYLRHLRKLEKEFAAAFSALKDASSTHEFAEIVNGSALLMTHVNHGRRIVLKVTQED